MSGGAAHALNERNALHVGNQSNRAVGFQLGDLLDDAQPASGSPSANVPGQDYLQGNDPTMRSMCISAQNLQSGRRIFMRIIEGLHFVFAAILSGAAQCA